MAAIASGSHPPRTEAFAMRNMPGAEAAPGTVRRAPWKPAVTSSSSLSWPSFSSLSSPSLRYGVGFFAFGLLNNSLYVVILTAALELLPSGVPTGVVALANIAPALVAKAVWPYLLKGRVRYARRVAGCATLSVAGMIIVAELPTLWTRLLGISLASFSSGLGELTFLQLATRYGEASGEGVGWFASGTGAAGLVGASAWWIVRPLGVRVGLLLLTFLPALMAAAYFLLLPSVDAMAPGKSTAAYQAVQAEDFGEADNQVRDSEEVNEERPSRRPSFSLAPGSTAAGYAALDTSSSGVTLDNGTGSRPKLSFARKMELIRPMLLTFILPLVLVYLFEYTINQGVAPTLLYPPPTRSQHPLLSLLIKRLRDWYPLYQLVYQTFVFLSRSSISILRMPAIPKRYLWWPAIVQGFILLLLISESLFAWFRASIASPLVIVLICIEGLAGGGAYVSVFYQIGTEDHRTPGIALNDDDGPSQGDTDADAHDVALRAQEREFRIGCVGVGDSFGILLAALVAMPLELALCRAQVGSGRTLCREV